MRPTTKDLARVAGVSLATVDRVLNGRSGVRADTVAAVNEAIARLGFVRNMSAANLARGRTYRLAFLLPQAGDQFLDSVISHIDEARPGLVSESVSIETKRVIGTDPHAIAATLATLDASALDGVAIMAPESPPVRDALARLRARGVMVVQFLTGSRANSEIDFVGVNNRAAGATAGRLMGRFSAARAGEILVIADRMNTRDAVERRQGFDSVLTADFPGLQALPSLETHGEMGRAEQVLQNALAGRRNIIGIYVMSSEARVALSAVASRIFPASEDMTRGNPETPVIIAHEWTPFTEAMLRAGQLGAVIAQNPGHLVRSAIRVMRARCDDRIPIASQEEIRIEILLCENLPPALAAPPRG